MHILRTRAPECGNLARTTLSLIFEIIKAVFLSVSDPDQEGKNDPRKGKRFRNFCYTVPSVLFAGLKEQKYCIIDEKNKNYFVNLKKLKNF